MKIHLLLALVLVLLAPGLSYRILVVTTVPSRSHGALGMGIIDPLLAAGHQVTWINAYGDWPPHENLTIIEVNELTKFVRGVDLTDHASKTINTVLMMSQKLGVAVASNQAVRETMKKDQYDAVVTEWFFQELEAGYAAVQQVPWIVLAGSAFPQHLEGLVHDTGSVSTVPSMMMGAAVPMGFWHRVINRFMYLSFEALRIYDMPSLNAHYESLFSPLAAARGVALPSLNEAKYNMSVVFVNSHPSVAPSLSLPPNVVHIGGYHIKENQPLPEDIKQLLDSSPEGVVYFSMGSVLKSSILPVSLRDDLIRMFAKIPFKVLWKFEEDIQDLPKNIFVRKWWPQADVLAHPNVKLFITHGGMLSTTEAVHYGVPLLAIPIFGDQPSNAARAVSSGYALSVPYSETMAPELEKALVEMLSNDVYYNQAKFLSKIFHKRPVHPSKEITNYIELAIESKGAYHLRSRSYYYPWYQRYMLDQLAALLAIIYSFYAAVRHLCCRRKDTSKIKRN